jgi:hypothetical protein
MSTLKSVDVWIDDLQHDKKITVPAKDYPPVVDHASVMRGSWNNTSVNPIDTIQGKMVTAQMSIDANQAIQMDDLELKNRLITKLVRELMDRKCIEFTKQQDVVTMETIVRARIFVTPDDEVRVIRKETNLG